MGMPHPAGAWYTTLTFKNNDPLQLKMTEKGRFSKTNLQSKDKIKIVAQSQGE